MPALSGNVCDGGKLECVDERARQAASVERGKGALFNRYVVFGLSVVEYE